jgi:hypothetical protein
LIKKQKTILSRYRYLREEGEEYFLSSFIHSRGEGLVSKSKNDCGGKLINSGSGDDGGGSVKNVGKLLIGR